MGIFKNTRITILIVFIVATFFLLVMNGLQYGLDFSGGTQFTITLNKTVMDPAQMEKVIATISKRLDWSGLKDVKVSSWDNRFILAKVAVSNQKDVAHIEELLQKQGKFENIFDGNVLFTGDEVVQVLKDPQRGYGIQKNGDTYRWTLPFMLNPKAARNFATSVFHKCMPKADGGYDCPKTYFFIDRPTDSVILIPRELYKQEEFMAADPVNPTGRQIKMEELLQNTNVNYFVVDSNIDKNTINNILALKKDGIRSIIIPDGFNTTQLKDLNMKIVAINAIDPYPWIWTATGLKSVIWLTESITNQDAGTMTSSNFKTFTNLMITGSARTREEANQKLETLYVILGAGSLPVGIDEISKEVVNPTLGKSFLNAVLLMGIIALLVVALIIFLRYRKWKLILPLLFTSLSEVFLILGFASLVKWNLDLTALAGIIAAVGTGVDDQIIITDELTREKEHKVEQSLVTRVKRAFFIIFATAATTIATMLPVLFVGGGISKLVGFAFTTITGVLIGVLITRPAYGEMAKAILRK